MKIGFFDSGVGGLTVLHDAIDKSGAHHYLYYADTDNVPYGTMKKSLIREYVGDAVEFLVNKGSEIIVIACNTATSVVIKQLRKKYDLPIIGMEPAVKPAVLSHPTGKVILFATKRTISENKLQELIERLNAGQRVEKIALQKLVKFAEEFDFGSLKMQDYLESKLRDIEWEGVSSVVLGCTHFLFYRKQFRELIPEHVRIVDGNKGTVKRINAFVKKKNREVSMKIEFIESGRAGNRERFEKYLDYYKKLKG